MVEMPRSPPQQNKLKPGISNKYKACFVAKIYIGGLSGAHVMSFILFR